MEIEFKEGVQIAMRCAMNLYQGELVKWPKGCISGEEYPDFTKTISFERPFWCNFIYFEKIKSSPIKKIQSFRANPLDPDSPGFPLFGRDVEFFHNGIVLVRVRLVGRNLDGSSSTRSTKGKKWSIQNIGYFRSYTKNEGYGWMDFEVEPIDLYV